MLIGDLWNSFEIFKESVVIDFYKICLAIDSIVYNAIAWIYSVFTTIASARLFDNAVIASFYNRIYMIISVIMLFIIAYSFLQIIINPDMMTKGNVTPLKIVTNVILSLLCVVLTPVVFNFAYSVQNAALSENIIGKVILGTSTQSEDRTSGNLAIDIFETQFYPKEEVDCRNYVIDFTEIAGDANTYCQADLEAREATDIGYFSYALPSVENGTVQYNIFLCFVVGVFVLYVLVVYVFDIALRTVKLAFYQLIAPIPSLLLIVPGQDKIFKSWLKEVIKTFLEVFLKSAILLFGVYLISLVRQNFNANNIQGLQNVSGSVLRFSKLFIYLGIVMFIKQAPKLISDIFGIKMDPGGFSLKKRLQDSGVAAFAGGLFGLTAGAISGYRGAKAGLDARGVTDAKERAFGAASGIFHGARLGRKAGATGNLSQLGASYKYAKANQAAWAHMDPSKSKFSNWANVQREMLYDNFGYPSYYESLVADKEIEFNQKNSSYNRALQSLDSQSKQRIKDLEDIHKFDVRKRANDTAITAGSDVDKTAEEEVLKDGYTETTKAFIKVRDISSGKLIDVADAKISGSQIDSIKKMYADAAKNGEITREEETKLNEELDGALKRLKSDFITNQMMMNHRDNAWAGTSEATQRANFKADYVASMKSSLDYKNAEEAGDTVKMSALESLWNNEANDRFDKIVANPGDYKANLNFINKVNAYNQTMDYTGANAVGVNAAGTKLNADIVRSEVGSALLKSIKAVKIENSKIDYEKNEIYRDAANNITYFDENGHAQTISLNEVIPERTRINDASKKLTEELKDFKMAHADEEQFAKIAKERKSMAPPKHKAGGKH